MTIEMNRVKICTKCEVGQVKNVCAHTYFMHVHAQVLIRLVCTVDDELPVSTTS